MVVTDQDLLMPWLLSIDKTTMSNSIAPDTLYTGTYEPKVTLQLPLMMEVTLCSEI